MSRTRIAIDPNVRVRGNGTYAGFEDVDGPLALHLPVQVHEPESGLVGTGVITEIDPARELVYLSVDWSSLRAEAGGSSAPTEESLAVLWPHLVVRVLMGGPRPPRLPYGSGRHSARDALTLLYYLHPSAGPACCDYFLKGRSLFDENLQIGPHVMVESR